MDDGKLIIITGFMAAGKDTVVNKILKISPEYKKVVTHTSRPPRKNEKEGVDYYFVSKLEFRNMLQKKLMLEHVIYETHYKGTHKKEIEVVFDKKNVIWRIDMERAAIVEDLYFEKYDKKTAEGLAKRTTKILLKPENFGVVLERSKNRDPESFDAKRIMQRLYKEQNIFAKYQHKFPHVVVNKTGKLDFTLKNIQKILGN